MYMYITGSVYKCNIACAKTCVFSRCLCDIIFPVLLLYIHVHVVLLKEELLYVFLFYFSCSIVGLIVSLQCFLLLIDQSTRDLSHRPIHQGERIGRPASTVNSAILH